MIFQAWIGKILMRREMCFQINQVWHISYVHEYLVREILIPWYAIYSICDCYHVWTNSVLLPFKIPETFPNGVYSTRYRFLCAMTVCPDPVFYVSARVRACMCLNVWTVGWLWPILLLQIICDWKYPEVKEGDRIDKIYSDIKKSDLTIQLKLIKLQSELLECIKNYFVL